MKKQNVEWSDFLNPTQKEIDALSKKFGLHPVIAEELKHPSARSRVENYGFYLFIVHYFPVYDPKEKTSHRTEIDFLISKDAIATIRYDEAEALREFERKNNSSTYMLTYEIIEALLAFQERQLRHIRDSVEAIGKELFKNTERGLLEKISFLKRDISEYRMIVRLQGATLRSLVTNGKQFWGTESEPYLEDLVGDHLNIVHQIEDCRETVSDFEDTNNQIMNMKINTVMQTFTSLSFLTFPFMLLAAIFSMNTKGTPIVDNPHAFWIILGFMATGMIVLATLFRNKKWF